MPDLKNLLNDEIRRLARKEIRIALEPLTAQIANQKKTISDLKKQIVDLEKLMRKANPEKIAEIEEAAENEDTKIRLNAAGIIRIRKKHKLTQSELAKLLGVATHTVSIWELGKSAPRAAMKQKICDLRSVGKREINARLAAAADVEEQA
ncbi:MAG: helix-turn-helix domain-containing protein [Lentisphaerae bacterium]|nr:helix-turn-helix domain-containing protein [Lentisphaerota bacterium]